MQFESFLINKHFINIYNAVFPQVLHSPDNYDLSRQQINGIYNQEAMWYGIRKHPSDSSIYGSHYGEDPLNDLMGFCTIGTSCQMSFIYNFGVPQQFRNQGVGSLLMENIIQRFGTKNLYLFVHKNNRVAIQLYRKFDFEYIDNIYVPPVNHICMVRTPFSTLYEDHPQIQPIATGLQKWQGKS